MKKIVKLTLLIWRLDRRNRCFWVRPSSSNMDYGLQRHDYSHQEITLFRGQPISYQGPEPELLAGGLDFDCDFKGGKYSLLSYFPDELIFDSIEFSQFYYGIGMVKLNKLRAIFQSNPNGLKELLAEASEVQLTEALRSAGFTKRSIEALVLGHRLTEWQLHCANIGIEDRACRNFFDVYRWQTLSAFEENPFRILTYADTTDYRKIWERLSLAYQNPTWEAEASWAALWAIFYDAGIRYHTSVKKAHILRGLTDLLGADLAKSTLRRVIKAGHLYIRKSACQLWPIRVFEQEIAKNLVALNTPCETASQSAIRPVDWSPLFDADMRRDDLDPVATIRQLKSFEEGQMLLIYGEAGTGKTYLAARILKQCAEAGWGFHVIAVSNIAVSRVRKELEPLLPKKGDQPEKIIRFSSVARFLSAKPKDEDEVPPHVLLLDEASMIGAGQSLQVLSKIRPCDRLIMVGDPRQIPPIGWGALFHALKIVQEPRFNQIFLTDRKRQQGSGKAILDMIDQLEVGDPLLQAAKGKAEAIEIFDPKGDPLNELEAYLRQYFQKHKGRRSAIRNVVPPIICLCREDVAQVNWRCRQLRAQMDSEKPKAWKFGFAEFRTGEPIINTVNRTKIGLWNGSRGRVVNGQGKLMAEFEEPDGTRKQYNLDSGIERAYAVTVHRAQGEGHDEVILYLGDNVPETLLHRGALYTAITRASKKLIIIGSAAQFDEGYDRPNHARTTNFLELAFESVSAN